MTQGETIEELEENLRDIHNELNSGTIPCDSPAVRHHSGISPAASASAFP